MKTEDLVAAELEQFIDAVATLDADTCERHARAIIRRLGAPVTFEAYLYELTRVALDSQVGKSEHQIDRYYRATKELFPGVLREDDILGRLAGLMLKMMAERLKPRKNLYRQEDACDPD
jgi:hypothetical protein